MATLGRAVGVSPRPSFLGYLWSWFTTVDHKRIGIMYGATTLAYLLLGGIEALLIRLQLAHAENKFLDPDTYNQVFTMHGLTMIFLVVMGFNATLFNLVVPLQIGARDVAYPRLNALSYWMFLFGSVLLNLGWLWGQAPDVGWFGYAPLTRVEVNPGLGPDFYVMGLQALGISSVASGLNFVATIINHRAPGMSLFRLPVFSWMALFTSFLMIFALPVLAVGLIEVMFDRLFGTNFFNAEAGANPLLWQHLFWVFGHPEVYILVLPAMGVISEVVPVFSKKPLFGYPFVVLSGLFIAFLSYGVWAHHMFAVGLGPVANTVFGITTMLIGIPTGVKIFNWLATLWRGELRLKTPMLFALAFIAVFTVGGISGVMHATVPSDYQQTDTYFVVAHFHYVVAGIVFAIFAGVYYWWPKYTGRLLDEGLGKAHFWLFFLGFNLTFGPMHLLGLWGMPRRQYTYPPGLGWDFLNAFESAAAFLMALGTLVFLVNAVFSLLKGKPAGDDPWDGRTLEWMVPTPPPAYNFAQIPVVGARDEFWVRKYGPEGVRVGASTHNPGHGADNPGHGVAIHLPRPSYYPAILAFGIGLGMFGAVLLRPVEVGGLGPMGWVVVGLGALITVFAAYGWSFEPAS
ncbi:MAG: cytochrome c oxidase subunit I [Chloroflexota bacterium]